MKKKRIANIAEAFARNSVSSMLTAVEMFNRPQITFRYQLTASLLLNAWNLALKAFNHKTNKTTDKTDEAELSESLHKLYELNRVALGNDFIVKVTSISLLTKFSNFPFSAYPDFVKPAAFSVFSANILLLTEFIHTHFEIDYTDKPEVKLQPVETEHKFDLLKLLADDQRLNELSEGSLNFLQAIVNTASSLYDHKFQTSVVVNFPQSVFTPKTIKNSEIIAAVNGLNDKALRVISQPVSQLASAGSAVNTKVMDKVYSESESNVIGFINSEFPGIIHSKSFKKLYSLAKSNTEMYWQKRTADKNGDRKTEGRFTKDVYVFLRAELTKAKESPIGPQIIQKSIFDMF